MLVGAVCGISDKYYSLYSCPLRQWSADYPLHPFHGKHTHSKSELVVIGRLSTFQSPEVDVYEELHPMRMLLAMLEAEKLTSLVKEEWGQVVSLRAPPAFAA